ncbi:MAG TPA: hypothetical protein VFA78_03790, partial [Chloroflexota bacterium]|nr:hypothetical protein [Chloroflexota bacterium]
MIRAAALTLLTLSFLLIPRAGAAAGDPALTLAASVFPHGAKLSARIVAQRKADSDSRLRTAASSAEAWSHGLEQTATWADGNRGYLSLRYLASVYATAAAAATVRSDAVASLWLAGTVCTPAGAFCIEERDGHRDVVRVLRRGRVEMELTLRIGAKVSKSAERTGMRILSRAADRAVNLAGRVPTGNDPATDPLPSIAPVGTGPVTESPALMVLAPSRLPGVRLYTGTYRSSAAWLVRRAVNHPGIDLAGGLSDYVVDGTVPGGRLYDTAVLYPNIDAATAAYNSSVTENKDLSSAGLTLPGDAAASWVDRGETIALIRDQNVLLELGATGNATGQLTAAANAVAGSVPAPLHAAGTQIVRSDGTPVRLVGFSWYGAESVDFVVGGLDYQPYESILATVKADGYNTIRIPL